MEEYRGPDNNHPVVLGHLARPRYNVLDILEHISRYSASVHMICDIDVSASEELACRLSARGDKITVTAILLKAISIAQLKHPDSATIRLPFGVKIKRTKPIAGFTVERDVDGQQAVFFGNIHDAQNKSLAEIARELFAYGRNDVMSVTQLTKETIFSFIPYTLRNILVPIGLCIPFVRELVNPATFGLTSLGKFAMGNVIAPNVTTSIFGIGSMADKPVVVDGEIVVRKIMSISYSIDSNIYNMYDAADFLNEIKTLMETGLAGHLHVNDEMREKVSSNSTNVQDDKLVAVSTAPHVDSPYDIAPHLHTLVPEEKIPEADAGKISDINSFKAKKDRNKAL
jgi:hypothetical protein